MQPCPLRGQREIFTLRYVKEKNNLILVKDGKEAFIQGCTAIAFCSKEERLGSTLNRTRKSRDLFIAKELKEEGP